MTSQAFAGEAKAIYGEDHKLILIDLQGCDMDERQIEYFKRNIPVWQLPDMSKAFPESKLTIIEESYQVTFEEFWSAYKVKHNRLRAEKLWNKLSKADQAKAFSRLKAYDRYLQINNWRNKAEPDTYLKNRYWENEWK